MQTPNPNPTNPKPVNLVPPDRRSQLRKVRQSVAHIFPGLVRIVHDRRAGTVKTSFEDTKMSVVLKHREIYARVLRKFGVEVGDAEVNFKIGTWRVKAGVPAGKKRLFHVLTLFVEPDDQMMPASLRVDFTPTWARKIQPKTDEEIDQEINAILTNREALIKRLRIKTITRQ
jgi:hypothetical protein